MFRHFLVSLVLVLCTGVGMGRPVDVRGAQDAATSECPKVNIDCGYSPNDTWTYSVIIEGYDNKKELTYKWSVSQGKIKSGQGTSTITIDRPDIMKGITVTVFIGGLPEGCRSALSCSTIS
jgi:hypothetical protein